MFVVKGNRLSKLPLVARRVLAIPSMTGRELLDALHSEGPQLAVFDHESPEFCVSFLCAVQHRSMFSTGYCAPP